MITVVALPYTDKAWKDTLIRTDIGLLSLAQPIRSRLEKKTSRVPIMYSKTRRFVAMALNYSGSVSCTRSEAVIAKTPREQNRPAMKE